MSGYITIYTDGSYNSKNRYCRWAYIVVKDNNIILEDFGFLSPTSRNNVELAESTALMRACTYCKEHKGNYVIITDSKACYDKIHKNCNNVSRQPNIKGIQNIVEEINTSIEPISITIKFKKRCSNEYMIRVDELSRI